MARSLTGSGLAAKLEASVGRHLQKTFDWDAFPASRGFPELARAQMRYVGSGGSPKVGDPTTLEPVHFTCSLLYQEPNRYAAVHTHEIEEIFLVHEGRLTVSWDFDDQLVDVVLGPGDALVNPPERAHGFRNDGPYPVLAQFMVGHPKPMLPAYKAHPSRGAPPPEFNRPPTHPADPRVLEVGRHLVRSAEVTPRVEELGNGSRLVRLPYVMPRAQGGVVEPQRFSLEMLVLPEGARTLEYELDHEVALMVWEGTLGAEFHDGPDRAETRLGGRDLLMVYPGQKFRVWNASVGAVRCVAVLGTASPSPDLWSSGRP